MTTEEFDLKNAKHGKTIPESECSELSDDDERLVNNLTLAAEALGFANGSGRCRNREYLQLNRNLVEAEGKIKERLKQKPV